MDHYQFALIKKRKKNSQANFIQPPNQKHASNYPQIIQNKILFKKTKQKLSLTGQLVTTDQLKNSSSHCQR